jgi:hypothetical protein
MNILLMKISILMLATIGCRTTSPEAGSQVLSTDSLPERITLEYIEELNPWSNRGLARHKEVAKEFFSTLERPTTVLPFIESYTSGIFFKRQPLDGGGSWSMSNDDLHRLAALAIAKEMIWVANQRGDLYDGWSLPGGVKDNVVKMLATENEFLATVISSRMTPSPWQTYLDEWTTFAPRNNFGAALREAAYFLLKTSTEARY